MSEDNKDEPVILATPTDDIEIVGGEPLSNESSPPVEGEKYDPKLIQPLHLLTDRSDRQVSFLNSIWNPVSCAATGFTFAIFLNWGFHKPPFSGIQKHILYMLAGGLIGKYYDNKQNVYYAKRDAILKHYIELHEEDFPSKERVKYADILEKWVPIR